MAWCLVWAILRVSTQVFTLHQCHPALGFVSSLGSFIMPIAGLISILIVPIVGLITVLVMPIVGLISSFIIIMPK